MVPAGRIVQIWIKPAHGAAMEPRRCATLVAGIGLEGNADRGGRRQVTVLDLGRWNEATAELGRRLDPSLRRANLLLEGIDLADSTGRVLRLGECLLVVRGESRPCSRMDEAWPGLRAVLARSWRGGVYGEVLRGGTIRPGDVAAWEPAGADVQR
ncbi:MAG: MOSC domain-containing protein [Acidobacteria bacterium]|nr:MAG: MOSC domain-containing protein [Acidobacteriota bacterium]